jgi:hypothetical protein
MHIFDPNSPLRTNWQNADDVAFAAWESAGHEHREKYRDSGQSPARSKWLERERLGILTDALADGELIALGISPDDNALDIREIPQNLFLSAELEIDAVNSAIAGLGREFRDVRICRASPANPLEASKANSSGRPTLIMIAKVAWDALKSANPNFLNVPKSTQNIEIQEMAATMFPAQFPGKCRIGESTIRRHRRTHPNLFT